MIAKVRVCDVTGVARGTRRYRLKIEEIDDLGNALMQDPVLKMTVDLGEGAMMRLARFIARGTNPATRKKKAGVSAGGVDPEPEPEPVDAAELGQ